MNIQKGLDVYGIKSTNYPNPEDVYGSGYIGTDELFEVGYIKENISNIIKLSKTPKDPVSKYHYVYGLSYDKKYYQIGATFENLQTHFIVPTTYASSYEAKVIGNYKGVLKKSDTLYNPNSLIIPYTGGKNLSEDTYFVTDKGQNLPYKLGNDTILTGGTIKTSTGISIEALKTGWNNTYSGSIEKILGVPLDTVGIMVYGEKKYFDEIKVENKDIQEEIPFSCPENQYSDDGTTCKPIICNYGETLSHSICEDPHWNNVSLLLHVNNENNIIDDSNNKSVITPVGTTGVNTTITKFSSGSIASTNNANNILSVPHSDKFNFGSSNFTIEGWIYPTHNTTGGIYGKRDSSAGEYSGVQIQQEVGVSGPHIRFLLSDGSNRNIDYLSNIELSLNNWHHFAVVREGNSLYLFIDGVKQSSALNFSSSVMTNTKNIAILGPSLGIGNHYMARQGYNGYINEFRVTKGVARYTNNLDPLTILPVKPFAHQ